MESSERITTSVLTNRLNNLERQGILAKEPHPTDQRSSLYKLTEKGIDLVPLLFAMTEWGTRHDDQSTGHRKKALINRIDAEQSTVSREAQDIIRAGGSVFKDLNVR